MSLALKTPVDPLAGNFALKDEKSGKIFPIQNGLVIGRKHPDFELRQDPSVSSKHCRITVENNVVSVEDLKSTNGTCINGIELQPNCPYELVVDGRLKIGDSVFTLVDVNAEKPDATQVVPRKEQMPDPIVLLDHKMALQESAAKAMDESSKALHEVSQKVTAPVEPPAPQVDAMAKVILFNKPMRSHEPPKPSRPIEKPKQKTKQKSSWIRPVLIAAICLSFGKSVYDQMFESKSTGKKQVSGELRSFAKRFEDAQLATTCEKYPKYRMIQCISANLEMGEALKSKSPARRLEYLSFATKQVKRATDAANSATEGLEVLCDMIDYSTRELSLALAYGKDKQFSYALLEDFVKKGTAIPEMSAADALYFYKVIGTWRDTWARASEVEAQTRATISQEVRVRFEQLAREKTAFDAQLVK